MALLDMKNGNKAKICISTGTRNKKLIGLEVDCQMLLYKGFESVADAK